jgi:cobalamin biosynthesis protein CobT
MVDDEHGLRRGKGLSSRMLVDSYTNIRNGQDPDRAYWNREETLATSVAACLIVDQSGSMQAHTVWAAQSAIAVADAFESIDGKVMVAGFRDGGSGYASNEAYSLAYSQNLQYHRNNSITYDVFKHFEERMSQVRDRMGGFRAVGGTPMADGVQFGLDQLNRREEGHRILLILTDGEPNGGHLPVIRHQIRLAEEAGIHIIGLGITNDARSVQTTFKDSVWCPKPEDMPKALIDRLSELLDKRALKRGRRMKATG